MHKIVLASSSPRRRGLLEQLGLKFRIISSSVDEDIQEEDPYLHAMKLAELKAEEVARSLGPGYLVIGADTIVLFENKILGKPIDEKDAYKMLRELSSNTHSVITGVAVVQSAGGKKLIDYQVTKVRFREISEKEIYSYIKTQEPMDKAGAYGVQGYGALFVDEILGDYYNVVGLPLVKLNFMLKEFDLEILN